MAGDDTIMTMMMMTAMTTMMTIAVTMAVMMAMLERERERKRVGRLNNTTEKRERGDASSVSRSLPSDNVMFPIAVR